MSHSGKEPSSLRFLISFAWSEKHRLFGAALCMGISAVATAGYAYLVGPVLRSLFLGQDSLVFRDPAVGTLAGLAEQLGALSPAVIGGAIVAAAVPRYRSLWHRRLLGPSLRLHTHPSFLPLDGAARQTFPHRLPQGSLQNHHRRRSYRRNSHLLHKPSHHGHPCGPANFHRALGYPQFPTELRSR